MSAARAKLIRAVQQHGSLENLIDATRRQLGLAAGETEHTIVRDACADLAFDRARLERAAEALMGGNDNDAKRGRSIAAWLVDNDHVDRTFVDQHVAGYDEFVAAAREWSVERAAMVCGVPAADIVRVAEWIATIHPAMLRTGWGMERNRNGASAYLAAHGVWALAGHFGVRGSGILDSTSKAFPNSVLVEWPEHLDRPDRGTINMNRVARIMNGDRSEWPVAPRVLVIQGANPAVTSVDQVGMLEALSREDVFKIGRAHV